VADQGATAGGTAGAPGGADDRVTEEITALRPGLCLTIPLGTHFQFRAAPDQALAVVAITMPPWPGEGEAVAVTGPWPVST
jgi:mannose-6-phosphate isomerase-like protein (cupin superfamily)